ncbi:MAG: peptidylprolyl isomerase [Tateyamaria sp.]|uniref:peptidylprolyl isomerase n=1 Tax=Tateyamaria sp. TaxID=1929288 RepID=UPI0032951C40
MKLVVRIIREPLFHFLLIGVAIFLAYSVLNEPSFEAESEKRIEVTVGDINQMIAQFRTAWRRAPNREELGGLIDAHVRENIMVQEALALSMDKGDAVIERRLSQKMAFLLESAAGAVAPTDGDLMAYFEENKAAYASAPMIAFEQVYFGEAADQSMLDQVLLELEGGADPASVGHRTLLPQLMPLSRDVAVDGAFGRGFFGSLVDLEAGKWIAPVRSGFGVHALRVIEHIEGTVPEFEVVRERVTADYKAFIAEELSRSMYVEMRAGYEVTLPETAEIDGLLQ